MPFENLSRKARRAIQAYARAEAEKRPATLTEIPQSEWRESQRYLRKPVIRVWQSRKYLVQMYEEGALEGRTSLRLSVSRVTVNDEGRWEDGLSWDDLMQVKREIGYGHWYAVEVYPRDEDIVNVANLRHLWLFATPLAIGWFKS
jgi:hypothetical protein